MGSRNNGDKGVGVYIPAENTEACIRDGAKKTRRGKDIQKCLLVGGKLTKIPLIYEPMQTTLAGLYNAEGGIFVDYRRACPTRGKSVMRCRPRFDKWQLAFSVNFDDQMINPKDLETAIKVAGAEVGLGDYRPRFGRFELVYFGEKPLAEI